MAIRGRKAKPTAIKILEGNPGKKKLYPESSIALKVVPSPPEFLLPDAKQAWEKIAKVLVSIEMLTMFDLASLAMCCQSYAQSNIARLQAEEFDKLQAGDKKQKQNPNRLTSNAYWKSFVLVCRAFGLSPHDFTLILEDFKPDNEANHMELLLAGRT